MIDGTKMASEVTFVTSCWEDTYYDFLNEGGCDRLLRSLRYRFFRRLLLINDVTDRKVVATLADKLVSAGIIDEYCFTEDYIEEAQTALGINRESYIKGKYDGYYYMIAHIVGIYLCETPFLLHMDSDTKMDYFLNGNWVSKGIQLLQERNDVLSINPVWGLELYGKPIIGKDEEYVISENKEWYFEYGFSDQCYLIKTSDFNSPIYDDGEYCGREYPEYGGNSFERRIDGHMRKSGRCRAVYKMAVYYHETKQNSGIKMALRSIMAYINRLCNNILLLSVHRR